MNKLEPDLGRKAKAEEYKTKSIIYIKEIFLYSNSKIH